MEKRLFILITTASVLLILVIMAYSQERRLWVQSDQNDLIYLYQDKFALIVAVENYKFLPRLNYPVSDAREIAQLLKKLGFMVQILENPSSDVLRHTLKRLPYTDLGGMENSAFLLYFAGHCHTQSLVNGRKLGYIIPTDAPSPLEDPVNFMTISLSMNEVVELALLLKNRHVLMIFDCCFSGSLFNLMRAIPSPVRVGILLPVRQFITAGRENEEVPDKSIFKKLFLKGIQGEADFNKDGFITGTELGKFLQGEVEKCTEGRQHPQYGKINNPELDKGDFVFITPGNKTIMPVPSQNGSGFIRPNTQKWYIYKDADSKENHGEWTNWMAQRNPENMMELSLVDRTHPYSGDTAIKVKVNFKNSSWGGIAVASLPNYWGETQSNFAYDLSNAERLVFYARGESGGESIQVKVAIAGDKPYGDSSKIPASTRWINLSAGWQRYELSLEGFNLRRVITPFSFVTDKAHNGRDSITIYLDEIYFVLKQ